nr:enolase 4 [Pseudochaenichthys georgianus]
MATRLSEEEQDLHHMKSAATEFYRLNRVPQELERALNQLFIHRPEDVHGYLADYFRKLCAAPRISRLRGKEVYDARGQLSIEAEVFCIVCNKEKSMSSAAVSSLSGPKEALLDQQRAADVRTAAQWVNEPLSSMLKGTDPCQQSEVDHMLSGATDALPVFMLHVTLLERHLRCSIFSFTACELVPQIITKTLELQKEMMRIMNTSTKPEAQAVLCDSGVLAVSYERPEQPLDLITEACSNSGLALGTEVQLALNCAAPELMDYTKGKYEIATGVLKTPDELVDMYQTLVSKYPAVVALIDPLRREDREQWEKLSNVIGDSCLLLSDITYKAKAPPLPGVRGHVLKHTQETTVSDLICITSEHKGSVMMMMTTCSEPCSEDSLSDIAVGLGLDFVKLGGLSGAERMTKYNRLISIEEELSQQGILASKEKHPPPTVP